MQEGDVETLSTLARRLVDQLNALAFELGQGVLQAGAGDRHVLDALALLFDELADRAFRIGQTRNVQVRKFIGSGTLEEKIDTMLDEKAALADLVVRDGESWLTELSTGDLRELFALSEGAVGE